MNHIGWLPFYLGSREYNDDINDIIFTLNQNKLINVCFNFWALKFSVFTILYIHRPVVTNWKTLCPFFLTVLLSHRTVKKQNLIFYTLCADFWQFIKKHEIIFLLAALHAKGAFDPPPPPCFWAPPPIGPSSYSRIEFSLPESRPILL